MRPRRPHLSQLAPGADAAMGERLRPDPRADAPETHGSFADILGPGCRRVFGVPGGSPVAPHTRSFTALKYQVFVTFEIFVASWPKKRPPRATMGPDLAENR